MRLSGVTADHYVLRGLSESVRRELCGIVDSPKCSTLSQAMVVDEIFSTLDNRYGKTWTTPDALRRWQSFSQSTNQSVSDFLSQFDKEKSIYESVTSKQLEESELVAKLLDAADQSIALKLQESHGSRTRSLSLEDVKADLLHFEKLNKKISRIFGGSINRRDAAKSQANKTSEQNNQERNDHKQELTPSSSNSDRKVIPRGRCYRCFVKGHNADQCQSGSIADYSSRCPKCGSYHAVEVCSWSEDDLSCGYCSARDHRSSVCTAPCTGKSDQESVHVVDASVISPISTSVAFSPCTVDFSVAGKQLSCLVDTGADVGLLDSSLVAELPDIARFSVGTILLNGVATSGIHAKEESVILPFLSVEGARPTVLLGRNSIAMVQEVGMLALSSLLTCDTNRAREMLRLCSARYHEPLCPTLSSEISSFGDGSQSVSTNFAGLTGKGENPDASILSWHKGDIALVRDSSGSDVLSDNDFVALPPPESTVGYSAGASVAPLIFPVDGNYRVHHIQVSTDLMIQTVNRLTDDLAGKPIPVQNAPGYVLYVCRCGEGDSLDTLEQKFKFEIDWPMDTSGGASWDSTRMVNSPSDEEKSILFEETKMYCSNNWWQPDPLPRPKGMPEGTIFPIRQLAKTTPIRPVLDFRVPNRVSPRASSSSNSVLDCHRQLLAALRPGHTVRQLDLKQNSFFPQLETIKILTDSTVAKSVGLPKVKSNRGIDYVVLRRLYESIDHIAGRLNRFADRLSSIHEDISSGSVDVHLASLSGPVSNEEVMAIQQADPLISSIIAKMSSGLDLYGPLPCSTNGARFVLSTACLLTRYTELVSLCSARADEVSRGISIAFSRWGYPVNIRVAPRTVIHDNGAQLLTEAVQAALHAWGFKGRTIMSRAPWVGGFYEVRHRLITSALRSLSAESSASQWHLDLPLIQLRLNLQPNEDSGFTPHALVFGYDAIFPASLSLLCSKPEICDRIGRDDISTDAMIELLNSLRVTLIVTDVGDLVLVRNPRRTQLDTDWRGPFRIKKILGSATFDVDTADSKIPRNQHQRNLKRWFGEDGEFSNEDVDDICDGDGHDLREDTFYGLLNKVFGRPLGHKILAVYRLSGSSVERVMDVNDEPFPVFIEPPLVRLGQLRTRAQLKRLKEWLSSG
ncbi:hypothetical protein FOL47_007364 [Perkinsus chesapeaki]|uniref:Integrase catalytic domain-containing protein n=1 Tax=Perkinsus chesapeaki TaxID=330153 RepID=A0A7J6LL29_PERCH|nr:hypothetical protein FOL47_007364 [Perkinsus chesapeaki]